MPKLGRRLCATENIAHADGAGGPTIRMSEGQPQATQLLIARQGLPCRNFALAGGCGWLDAKKRVGGVAHEGMLTQRQGKRESSRTRDDYLHPNSRPIASALRIHAFTPSLAFRPRRRD